MTVPIRIGFSASRGLLGRFVRWFTRSPINHTWIAVRSMGLELIIHSTVGGVQVDLRDKWEKRNRVVEEYRVIPDVTEGFHKAMSYLGDRYDYLGLLGFVPYYIGRWFGRKVKNPWASTRAVVCSELIVRLRAGGKLPEWDSLDPESTAPSDLLEACQNSEHFSLMRMEES